MHEANLHQLRIFESVVRHASFSRAAKELSISQPAVSVQVQELEKGVGTPLLLRLGKTFTPTEAGEIVLQYAGQIFGLVDEMDIALTELKGFRRGTIKIGATCTFAEYVFPSLLATYQEQYPGISVQMRLMTSDELLGRLLSGEICFGLAAEPQVATYFDAIPIGQDNLVVIAPADHRYAWRRRLDVASLRNERWIIREVGSEPRTAFDQLSSDRGLGEVEILETQSNEAVKRSVSAGLGVGLISNLALFSEDPKRIAVLDVPELQTTRTFGIIRHQQRRINRTEKTFMDHVLVQTSSAIETLGAVGSA